MVVLKGPVKSLTEVPTAWGHAGEFPQSLLPQHSLAFPAPCYKVLVLAEILESLLSPSLDG